MLLAENMMNLFFIMGEFDCDKLYVIVIDMCVIVESVSNAWNIFGFRVWVNAKSNRDDMTFDS